MFYVFCDRASGGARELVEALGATRIRRFDGRNFWQRKAKVMPRQGDTIICWGGNLPEFEGATVLNGDNPGNKFKQAQVLQKAGVPTISVQPNRPKNSSDGTIWLPRSNYHVGGNDLLHSPARADFWVKKEDLVNEYRMHIFAQRAIRAGRKMPREGATPHPWIRSYDAGWRIVYDDFESSKPMRSMAKKAVKALGLMFGAVDVGERRDGSLIVLEVNKAPGLEGNTIITYVNAIRRWSNDPRRAGEGAE